MTVQIRHEFNVAEINHLLDSAERGVVRDLLRRGNRVATEAKRRCPVDHGRLRSSITVSMIRAESGGVGVQIGTDVKYARWVHDGTGLYGPRQARIYPRNGKYLVFTPRKANGLYIKRSNRTTVFARSTRGMRGRPFLREALPYARGV